MTIAIYSSANFSSRRAKIAEVADLSAARNYLQAIADASKARALLDFEIDEDYPTCANAAIATGRAVKLYDIEPMGFCIG